MSLTPRQKVGKWGEEAAARYLERLGYKILARNAYTAYGELDLVASQAPGELVFIEVKTRTNKNFGLPEEAVDSRKLAHLVSSAQAYLLNSGHSGVESWRIDVISVMGSPDSDDANVRFEHFENVAS